MADGLRTGELLCVGDVIEKSAMKDNDNGENCVKIDSVNENECENVDMVSLACDSDKLFKNLCSNNDGSKHHEGILPCEDDCRKKRCVDRYDSSESSDRFVNSSLTFMKHFHFLFHSLLFINFGDFVMFTRFFGHCHGLYLNRRNTFVQIEIESALIFLTGFTFIKSGPTMSMTFYLFMRIYS